MAHVLVAYRDSDLRESLEEILTQMGHSVTTVADGALAVAALWVARWPMVALLAGDLGQPDAGDIIGCAASEARNAVDEPRLARHQYIVITTSEIRRALGDLRSLSGAPHATLLAMPVDLYELLDAISEAEERLPLPAISARTELAPACPQGVRELVHIH